MALCEADASVSAPLYDPKSDLYSEFGLFGRCELVERVLLPDGDRFTGLIHPATRLPHGYGTRAAAVRIASADGLLRRLRAVLPASPADAVDAVAAAACWACVGSGSAFVTHERVVTSGRWINGVPHGRCIERHSLVLASPADSVAPVVLGAAMYDGGFADGRRAGSGVLTCVTDSAVLRDEYDASGARVARDVVAPSRPGHCAVIASAVSAFFSALSCRHACGANASPSGASRRAEMSPSPGLSRTPATARSECPSAARRVASTPRLPPGPHATPRAKLSFGASPRLPTQPPQTPARTPEVHGRAALGSFLAGAAAAAASALEAGAAVSRASVPPEYGSTVLPAPTAAASPVPHAPSDEVRARCVDTPPFRLGQHVSVMLQRGVVSGDVVFVGVTARGAPAIGVRTDAVQPGAHDGVVDGRRYFTCERGRGLLVHPRVVSATRTSPFA